MGVRSASCLGRIHSADREQAGPHRVVPALLGGTDGSPTVYFKIFCFYDFYFPMMIYLGVD